MVSDLFVEATARKPLFVVTAAVFREGGGGVPFINVSLPAERVAAVSEQQNVPAGVMDRRLGDVYDRGGRHRFGRRCGS